MQVPVRRAEKIPKAKLDFHITEEKYQELKSRLDKLTNIKRPREAEEVKRLAMMGDFSENAAYQLAKARLRGINSRILEIENLLKHAEIIKPQNSDRVALGHIIALEKDGLLKSYRLLGSAETDPSHGTISHNSPLGQVLLGKKVGDIVKIQLPKKEIIYKIVAIE